MKTVPSTAPKEENKMSTPTHIIPKINVMVDQEYRTEQLRLAKKRTNAVLFIAWVVGIWVALSLIAGIALAIAVNQTPTVNPDISNCLSIGGIDPSC